MIFLGMPREGTKKYAPLIITAVLIAVVFCFWLFGGFGRGGELPPALVGAATSTTPAATTTTNVTGAPSKQVEVSPVKVESSGGAAGQLPGSAVFNPLTRQDLVAPAGAPRFDYQPTEEELQKNVSSEEARHALVAGLERNIAALKKDPNDPYNWLQLGNERKIVGDYQGATEAWEYAGWLRPALAVPFLNLANLYHFYIKDYQKAERYYHLALRNDPFNVAAYIALSENLKTQGSPGKAKSVLLDGLKAVPSSTDIMVALAEFYRGEGNKTKVVSYYQQAAEQAARVGNAALAAELRAEAEAVKNGQ
jgi:hypothetical protein